MTGLRRSVPFLLRPACDRSRRRPAFAKPIAVHRNAARGRWLYQVRRGAVHPPALISTSVRQVSPQADVPILRDVQDAATRGGIRSSDGSDSGDAIAYGVAMVRRLHFDRGKSA